MSAAGGAFARAIEFADLWRNLNRSPSGLRRLQEQRLRRAVRDAYDHVPFWRARFDAAGIGPGEIRSLEDLARIRSLRRRICLPQAKRGA